MEKSKIRILYLYVFALVGLALVAVGTVRMVDLGLKIYIFKKADQQQRFFNTIPYPPIAIDQKDGEASYSEKITPEQKASLDRWAVDYKNWEENQKNFDYLASDRQRAASNSMAMILVGLPLYLYHWRIIKKEAKENGGENDA
jgi:hypothetical protein